MTQGELMQRMSAQEFGRWVALGEIDRERAEKRKNTAPDEQEQAQKLRELGFQVAVTDD